MADNVQLNAPTTSGATIATDDVGGVQHQLVKVEFGTDGAATQVSASAPLPVVQTGTPALPTGAATAANQQTDALTDTQLRANPVPISGTVSTGLSQPLTDAELRATPVPVSGTFYQATQPVSANDLDIRDLSSATDSIDVSGSTVNVGNTGGLNAVNVQDGGNSLTVDAIDLDIRNLVFATDKVDASGTVLGGGDNNIGNVDVVTLPSIPAGTNNIGDVDVLTMPAITGTVTAIPSVPLFRGSTASFRTLGRAGTAGQKIAAIHNATGSSIKVKVRKVRVDWYCTVVKAVTVPPPIVRLWKFTDVPTNGTVLTKNKIGGSTTSSASCTLWGDASADGTGSATTLTVTLPAGTIIDQHMGARIITAVGEVNVFELEFDFQEYIELAALEGVCVFLAYTAATSNPITDMWVTTIQWEETT